MKGVMTVAGEVQAAREWDEAPKTDEPCDRRVYTGTDPVTRSLGEIGVCGAVPTARLEGCSRGTRGKVAHRCREHAVGSARVYRVPRHSLHRS